MADDGSPSFAVERIDHVEVFVRDLESAVRWYDDVLGLKEIRRWDPHPIMIGLGDTKLALFKAAAGSQSEPMAGVRWRRVAWLTDETGFAHAQRHLKARNIPFEGPIDHEGAFSIYFADPDGNPLEITYYEG